MCPVVTLIKQTVLDWWIFVEVDWRFSIAENGIDAILHGYFVSYSYIHLFNITFLVLKKWKYLQLQFQYIISQYGYFILINVFNAKTNIATLL